MATCPRCKGHLTDSHRCPRRPIIVALETVLAAVMGGAFGLLLVVLFDPRNQISDVETMYFVIGGAVAGVVLGRTFR